jgi:hypothetical protein
MKILKSVVGVIVGYLVFAVSTFSLFRFSGRDPHEPQNLGFMLLSIGVGMAVAGAGGYLAGVIAGRSSGAHGVALAVLIASGATASILGQSGGSHWSQIAALTLMAPAAIVGGVLHARGRPVDR